MDLVEEAWHLCRFIHILKAADKPKEPQYRKILKDMHNRVPEIHASLRNAWLHMQHVETVRASARKKSKGRGRMKADHRTIVRDKQIADAWRQAREAGTYKADFAKQVEMNLRQLDALLDRVAARKRRSGE